ERDQYDYIIHAAGLTRGRNLEEFERANVQPTKNLAEASLLFPIKKFLLLSSLAAVGPIPYNKEKSISEMNALNPVTNYGRSKLKAEQVLMEYPQVPWLIFRPTAVYGPREKDLLILFKTLKKRLELYIGKQDQILSFVYAKDLVSLCIHALKSEKKHEIYNISDGHAYTQYDLANAVKDTLYLKSLKIHLPLGLVKSFASLLEMTSRKKAPVLSIDRLNELTAENWNVNIEKAQKDFNYLSEYNLQRGIKETIEWYQEKKWL
ncbi:MAG: NAD(P)-dependent oxidoreductase, partial [Ginsengibacter sp.]